MMGIQHAKAFQDAGKNVIVFLDVDESELQMRIDNCTHSTA